MLGVNQPRRQRLQAFGDVPPPRQGRQRHIGTLTVPLTLRAATATAAAVLLAPARPRALLEGGLALSAPVVLRSRTAGVAEAAHRFLPPLGYFAPPRVRKVHPLKAAGDALQRIRWGTGPADAPPERQRRRKDMQVMRVSDAAVTAAARAPVGAADTAASCTSSHAVTTSQRNSPAGAVTTQAAKRAVPRRENRGMLASCVTRKTQTFSWYRRSGIRIPRLIDGGRRPRERLATWPEVVTSKLSPVPAFRHTLPDRCKCTSSPPCTASPPHIKFP